MMYSAAAIGHIFQSALIKSFCLGWLQILSRGRLVPLTFRKGREKPKPCGYRGWRALTLGINIVAWDPEHRDSPRPVTNAPSTSGLTLNLLMLLRLSGSTFFLPVGTFRPILTFPRPSSSMTWSSFHSIQQKVTKGLLRINSLHLQELKAY